MPEYVVVEFDEVIVIPYVDAEIVKPVLFPVMIA
jgi:hypothetical protein